MTTVEKIMSSQTVRPKRFRVDKFRKMTKTCILPEESGWKVIGGYLIDKMTLGSKHTSVVKKLNQILTSMEGDKAIVSVRAPIQIDEYDEPEPDIAVLKPRADFYADDHPTLSDVFCLSKYLIQRSYMTVI